MPLDKQEYKRNAKLFFGQPKLRLTQASWDEWLSLLLPKLSASVVQELLAEVRAQPPY